ncbi:uncharacterized protein LOC144149337 isoform X4 [Haemaphysalis longicornis]
MTGDTSCSRAEVPGPSGNQLPSWGQPCSGRTGQPGMSPQGRSSDDPEQPFDSQVQQPGAMTGDTSCSRAEVPGPSGNQLPSWGQPCSGRMGQPGMSPQGRSSDDPEQPFDSQVQQPGAMTGDTSCSRAEVPGPSGNQLPSWGQPCSGRTGQPGMSPQGRSSDDPEQPFDSQVQQPGAMTGDTSCSRAEVPGPSGNQLPSWGQPCSGRTGQPGMSPQGRSSDDPEQPFDSQVQQPGAMTGDASCSRAEVPEPSTNQLPSWGQPCSGCTGEPGMSPQGRSSGDPEQPFDSQVQQPGAMTGDASCSRAEVPGPSTNQLPSWGQPCSGRTGEPGMSPQGRSSDDPEQPFDSQVQQPGAMTGDASCSRAEVPRPSTNQLPSWGQPCSGLTGEPGMSPQGRSSDDPEQPFDSQVQQPGAMTGDASCSRAEVPGPSTNKLPSWGQPCSGRTGEPGMSPQGRSSGDPEQPFDSQVQQPGAMTGDASCSRAEVPEPSTNQLPSWGQPCSGRTGEPGMSPQGRSSGDPEQPFDSQVQYLGAMTGDTSCSSAEVPGPSGNQSPSWGQPCSGRTGEPGMSPQGRSSDDPKQPLASEAQMNERPLSGKEVRTALQETLTTLGQPLEQEIPGLPPRALQLCRQEPNGQQPGSIRPRRHKPRRLEQNTPNPLQRQSQGPGAGAPEAPEPKGRELMIKHPSGHGSRGEEQETQGGKKEQPKGQKRQAPKSNTPQARAKRPRVQKQEFPKPQTLETRGRQPKGGKRGKAGAKTLPQGRPCKATCNAPALPSPQPGPVARQPKRTPLYRLNLDFAEGTPLVCSSCQESFVCKDAIAKHILEVHYNLARVNDDRPLMLVELRSALRQAHFSGVARFNCPETGCGLSVAAFMTYYKHLKTCGPFQDVFESDGESDGEDKVSQQPRQSKRARQAKQLQGGAKVRSGTLATLQRSWRGKFVGPARAVPVVDATLKRSWRQALAENSPISCPNEGCLKRFRTAVGLQYHYPRCDLTRLYRCLNCKWSTFRHPKSLLKHLQHCCRV